MRKKRSMSWAVLRRARTCVRHFESDVTNVTTTKTIRACLITLDYCTVRDVRIEYSEEFGRKIRKKRTPSERTESPPSITGQEEQPPTTLSLGPRSSRRAPRKLRNYTGMSSMAVSNCQQEGRFENNGGQTVTFFFRLLTWLRVRKKKRSPREHIDIKLV